jgi:NitT/TauT family transport system permease protein
LSLTHTYHRLPSLSILFLFNLLIHRRSKRAAPFPILWKVIFPAALPFIVSGLRTGIATAFIMVFVSELAGASAGIGYQISVSHLAYRVDRMIAALILLGVFGAVSDLLLIRFIWLAFPWLRPFTHR